MGGGLEDGLRRATLEGVEQCEGDRVHDGWEREGHYKYG